MKSVLKLFIVAAMLSISSGVICQVKIDLKKQVITIDKNAKANVKKEVAKDQGKSPAQNQPAQDKKETPQTTSNTIKTENQTGT